MEIVHPANRATSNFEVPVIGYFTYQNNFNCVNTSQNKINRVKQVVTIISVMKRLLKMDREEACTIKAP